MVSKNRPEFLETYAASLRSGIRFTPVNFHLTALEAAYIIDNCEAKTIVYDAALATAGAVLDHTANCSLRLSVGGEIPGFDDFDAAIASYGVQDIEQPVRGSTMLYTSMPKGVWPPARTIASAQLSR